MSSNQYFRVGVGVVLYNTDNQIYLFKRTDLPDVWQFPQGGMDEGEMPLDTMWRELEEETGLTEDDIAEVNIYPQWLLYEYDLDKRPTLKDPNCVGQIHHWFFLEVMPETVINLDTATHDEFSEFKLGTFEELLEQSDPLKNHVYEALAEYFETEL